jgi:thiamine biosynthesis lipoprotein
VCGERAPGLPWRIGVQHPLVRDRVAAVLATPDDLAVATSGAYERGAHVVDPHTGRPGAVDARHGGAPR